MNTNCENCKETFSAYLSDVPSKWREQIVNTICKAIDDKYTLKCEDVRDCETLTSLAAFEIDGTNVCIKYKAENGVTVTRCFDIADVIEIPDTLTFSTGLTNTSGTITADLSTGKSGGQSVIGGTGASNNLQITSTTNATKGKILIGSQVEFEEPTGEIVFAAYPSTRNDGVTTKVLYPTGAGRIQVGTLNIDEQAQDAVGSLLTDTATIDLTYNDGTPSITADVIDDSITFAKMQNISTDKLLGRDTASTGDVEQLSVGGGLEFTGSGGIQTSGLTGDITKSAGSTTTTIPNDTVTFAKMQNISTSRLLGRTTASTGDVEQLTVGSNILLSGGVLNTYGHTLINTTIFTSSGTWTKPTGCTAALVYVVGGGGGGGGSNPDASEASCGSGGGGGATVVVYLTSGLGATETVTIGAGGTGGDLGSGYVGNNGIASSFGAHTVAGGGFGGTFLASDTTVGIAVGGLSGLVATVPGTQVYHSAGAHGDTAYRLSASVVSLSTKGGDTTLGSSSSFGVNYSGYGTGGFGKGSVDSSAETGNDAKSGIVIVYELS